MMANAQQPTCRTRHTDLKTFALLDWVQHDLMILKRINTKHNSADALTKQAGKQLFSCRFDYIMDRIKPQYVYRTEMKINNSKVNNFKIANE